MTKKAGRLVQITAENMPHAGTDFEFAIHASGRTRVEAYINGELVLGKECPDPPCHETLFVPYGTGGSVFHAIATDSLGRKAETTFTILDINISSGREPVRGTPEIA